MSKHIPRVYFERLFESRCELVGNQLIHLRDVLKLRKGSNFIAFNKEDGEWLCQINSIAKRAAEFTRTELLRQFKPSLSIYLAFCPIKNDKTKFIVEKATELGVSKLILLKSTFTNASVNLDKLNSIAISAAEQSERIDVPSIEQNMDFENFLNTLPPDINWFSCIERDKFECRTEKMKQQNCGFIIGPEGGFSDNEKGQLLQKTTPISLSANVLRSETAAIAALSIFNFFNS